MFDFRISWNNARPCGRVYWRWKGVQHIFQVYIIHLLKMFLILLGMNFVYILFLILKGF